MSRDIQVNKCNGMQVNWEKQKKNKGKNGKLWLESRKHKFMLLKLSMHSMLLVIHLHCVFKIDEVIIIFIFMLVGG